VLCRNFGRPADLQRTKVVSLMEGSSSVCFLSACELASASGVAA